MDYSASAGMSVNVVYVGRFFYFCIFSSDDYTYASEMRRAQSLRINQTQIM